jgi:hypothetical protein
MISGCSAETEDPMILIHQEELDLAKLRLMQANFEAQCAARTVHQGKEIWLFITLCLAMPLAICTWPDIPAIEKQLMKFLQCKEMNSSLLETKYTVY